MRILTWNINSVRSRLAGLARIAARTDADVICLQETKTADDTFPCAAIAELGYPHQVFSGIKSYNGVAIVSRRPLSDAGRRSWCGRDDARHVFATVDGVELHCVYVPAGGDVPDPETNDKFAHKLQFLDEMTRWWRRRRADGTHRILAGDLNIAPLETDVWSHTQLLKVVSHTPVEVERLGRLQAAGPWVDAIREIIPSTERLYSWWSYRARDWAASDRGRRLDHVWISEALRPKLADAAVHRDARGWESASDHVPVTVTLSL